MLLQIINEYKQIVFMNILFIKRYRINRISASANEFGSFFYYYFLFFLPSNTAKRIVAIVKTFRYYALDNFFWAELLHGSKQNLLKCGKRTKTM